MSKQISSHEPSIIYFKCSLKQTQQAHAMKPKTTQHPAMKTNENLPGGRRFCIGEK